MSEENIEQQSEQPEGQEQKPKGPSARMLAIEQIAEVAEKQHVTDTLEYEQQYGDEDAQKAADAQPPLEQPEQKQESRKFKGKVDGQEIEFDEQAVIEAGLKYLQKDRAADMRLEKASLLWKQAQQAAAAKVLPEPESQPSSEEDAREIARKLQLGNEDEAAAAVEQIRRTGQQQGLTPQQIEQGVRQIIRDEQQKQEGLKLMREAFGDIAADPYLMSLAATEEDRLLATGDKRTAQERWKAIATELSLFTTWKSKAGQGLEQRQQAKAAQQLPEPAGGRRPAPALDKPQTVDETVEEIRQRRLQGRKINVRPTMGR